MIEMFDQALSAMRAMYANEAGKIVYLLSFTITLMIVDFITGVVKAYVHHNISSEIGKKGLTMKILIVIVLIMLIPLHIIIPSRELGVTFLVMTYLGYILFELTSIIENFKQMGVDMSWIKPIVDRLKVEANEKDKTGKEDKK